MQEIVKQEAQKLAKIMASGVDATQIYLFGSYAYGTPNKDSDLDFYIITKLSGRRKHEVAVQARKLISKISSFPIDILVDDEKDFNIRKQNATTIEHIVANKGVILFG